MAVAAPKFVGFSRAAIQFLAGLAANKRPGLVPIRNPFSVGSYLVDGRVAGAWSVVGGRIVLDSFEELSKKDAALVERERTGLQRLHA